MSEEIMTAFNASKKTNETQSYLVESKKNKAQNYTFQGIFHRYSNEALFFFLF